MRTAAPAALARAPNRRAHRQSDPDDLWMRSRCPILHAFLEYVR